MTAQNTFKLAFFPVHCVLGPPVRLVHSILRAIKSGQLPWHFEALRDNIHLISLLSFSGSLPCIGRVIKATIDVTVTVLLCR